MSPWHAPPEPLELAGDACHVWWAEPGLAEARHEELLEPAERQRQARFRRAVDRDRFTVGRVLVRMALARYLSLPPGAVTVDRTCPECGEPHGKPRPRGDAAGLALSVSHSGARVVVAVARDVLVGVDVEESGRTLEVDGLARRLLTPEEQEDLTRIPEHRRRDGFLAYWTRKEAVLKATGDGLRVPFDGLRVSAPWEPPVLLDWPARPDLAGQVALHSLAPGPGYAACLALVGGSPKRVRELDAAPLLQNR